MKFLNFKWLRLPLFFLTLFNCIPILTNAQFETKVTPNTSYHAIESKSIVRYETNATIFIEMNQVEFPRMIEILDSNGRQLSDISTSRNQFVVENLSYGKDYTLKLSDRAVGEVLDIPINISKKTGGQIEVSKKMFGILADFVEQERLTIDQYLFSQSELSRFESISYIQEFTDDNIIRDSGTNGDVLISLQIPDIPGFTPKTLERSCNCKINMTQYASPTGGPTVDANGNLIATPMAHEVGEFNNKSRWWYWRTEKGPAKYHVVGTKGWNSGGSNRQYNYSNYQGEGMSPLLAEVGYHYLCLGPKGRPSRQCDCSVNLTLEYLYDVKIDVRATLRSGIQNKKSKARSEDLAMIIENKVNSPEFELLDSGRAEIQRECETSIESDWFMEYLDLLGVVGDAVLLAEGYAGDDITVSGIVDDFISEAQDLLETPIFVHSGQCGSHVDEGQLLNNNYNTELFPGRPIEYRLYSFTHQWAGGKRNWDSHAINASNFSIVGLAEPRNYSYECCSDAGANWVFGAMDGKSPSNTGDMRTAAGAFINLMWPFFALPTNQFTNAYELPTEVGFIDDILCEGNGNLNSGNELTARKSSNSYSKELLSLMTLDGRKIMDLKGSSKTNLNELKRELQIHNQLLSAGIYIINYLEDGIPKSDKIFLAR